MTLTVIMAVSQGIFMVVGLALLYNIYKSEDCKEDEEETIIKEENILYLDNFRKEIK